MQNKYVTVCLIVAKKLDIVYRRSNIFYTMNDINYSFSPTNSYRFRFVSFRIEWEFIVQKVITTNYLFTLQIKGAILFIFKFNIFSIFFRSYYSHSFKWTVCCGTRHLRGVISKEFLTARGILERKKNISNVYYEFNGDFNFLFLLPFIEALVLSSA